MLDSPSLFNYLDSTHEKQPNSVQKLQKRSKLQKWSILQSFFEKFPFHFQRVCVTFWCTHFFDLKTLFLQNSMLKSQTFVEHCGHSKVQILPYFGCKTGIWQTLEKQAGNGISRRPV